jgi:glycosyltransferase involved in cell wall biosynthesis
VRTEQAPHVAVDARMVGHSGIGTYLSNLLPRIAAHRPAWRWTLIGKSNALLGLDWPADAKVRVAESDVPIYSIREQLELAVKAPRDANLFWSPHYNIPLAYVGRLMVTLHDIGHLSLPQFFPGAAQRVYSRTMFGALRLRARAIVCDSEFTRGEYARLVGVGKANPRVVFPGIDSVWMTPASPISPHPRPYLVCVGVVKAHKNVGTLIHAFAKIMHEIPHDLVVVGRRAGMRTVDEEAERAAEPLGSRVVFTGEVPFDRLRDYVAHAAALVTTSLHEGFGLPPLEAMAAGTPCVVSNVTALPEAAGDAALYCDPRNAEDVAVQIRRLLTDAELRRALIEKGRQRAATFTWERCAAQTAGVMDEALS